MSALDTITAALLNVLPSFNKTNGSVEAKIIDVVGTFADTEILERNNTINVINQALANQKVTTVEYYRRKAVAYQKGYTLSYDPINQGGYYETIDPVACVVKQAYIIGVFPQYTLLVNTLDDKGHLHAMLDSEVQAFKTYFAAFMPLGLELNINSLRPATIKDAGMMIYIIKGADAGSVADSINKSFIAQEAVLRTTNVVSLSELEDIIQRTPEVVAVGWGDPLAEEQQLDGSIVTVRPVKGLFPLTNGAFTMGTEVTVDMVKTIQ